MSVQMRYQIVSVVGEWRCTLEKAVDRGWTADEANQNSKFGAQSRRASADNRPAARAGI
jgi:hypothetical protein